MNNDTEISFAEEKKTGILNDIKTAAQDYYDADMQQVSSIRQLPAPLFNMAFHRIDKRDHHIVAIFATANFDETVLLLNSLPLLPLYRVECDGITLLMPKERADWPMDDAPAEGHNTVLGAVESRVVLATYYLDEKEIETALEAWIRLDDGTLCCLRIHLSCCAARPVLLQFNLDGKATANYTDQETAQLWPVFERCAEPAEDEPTLYLGYKPLSGDIKDVQVYDHALSADKINEMRADDEIG